MITGRQETILNALVKEYISVAEPISSKLLKTRADLDVCEATIRNELQKLTETGFIEQPHTSAGRVPTKKAYKYFCDKIACEGEAVFGDFIVRQVRAAHEQIEKEIELAEELMRSLSQVSTTFNYTSIQNADNLLEILEILGPSKTAHDENINLINKIIKELENF